MKSAQQPQPGRQGQVSYRWALDTSGNPIPIEAALRGQAYFCPLCQGSMIPRQGQYLQHHYSHEVLTDCTPIKVNRALLRRWLTIQITYALQLRRSIPLQWECRICGEKHRTDLEGSAIRCVEGYVDQNHYADLALLDNRGSAQTVIIISEHRVDLIPFKDRDLLVMMLAEYVTPSTSVVTNDPMTVLDKALIADAPCPHLQSYPDLVRDADQIKQILIDSVSRFPGYIAAESILLNGRSNLVKIGNQTLWLSKERWLRIVGGTLNRVSSIVDIWLQLWDHADGGRIGLYYVSANKTEAIGIKRHGPGDNPMPSLDGRIHRINTTAYDIARFIVSN